MANFLQLLIKCNFFFLFFSDCKILYKYEFINAFKIYKLLATSLNAKVKFASLSQDLP